MKSYNTLEECLSNKKNNYIFYQETLNKNYSIATIDEILIFQRKKKCNIYEYVNFDEKLKLFFYIKLINNKEDFYKILNNITLKLNLNIDDLIIIQENDMEYRIIHKYLYIENYDKFDEYLFKFNITNINLEKKNYLPSILNNDVIINEKYNLNESILNYTVNMKCFNINTNIKQIIKEDKYINNIEFNNCNTIFIKSRMGSGKSTATVNYIKNNNIKSFLIFSCRRTLTYSIYEKLKDNNINVDNYLISKKNIKLSEQLIISPDSIDKIEFPLRKFDLIWIDEGVSFMYYLGNYLYTNKNNNIKLIIEWLIKNCNKLLITDADFDFNIINYYLYFRNISKSNYIIYKNKIKNNTYNIYDTEDTILKQLKIDIINKKKLYICCDTLNKSKKLYEYINSLKTNNTIFLYNSETENKYEKLMYNVNDFWNNYDIVIVSPKVVFGVDFNLEYFDYVYGFYKCTTLTVRESIQQLNRIRTIKMQQINLIIYKKKKNNLLEGLVNIKNAIEHNKIDKLFYKKTKHEIDNILNNITYYIDTLGYKYIDMNNSINYLILYCINEKNNSLNSFEKIFTNKIK